MLENFAAVLVFILLGTAFVFGNLLIGWFLRPSKKTPEKTTVYECGEPTIGLPWIRFNSRFYTVALVYLLFDVEVVVLVPAMLVLKQVAAEGLGVPALAALMVFIALLTLGLAYEWFYGNLDWIRQEDTAREEVDAAPARPLAPAEAPRT